MCLLCGTFSTNDTTVSAHQKWTSVKFNREIYNQLLPETYSFDYQLKVCIVCIYVYTYVCMYVYSNTTPLDLGINFFSRQYRINMFSFYKLYFKRESSKLLHT